jgi:hypothetical protein
MSGAAHGKAESPRLSGTVSNTPSFPPISSLFRPDLPRRRKSEGGRVSKATSSRPHRLVCGPEMGRGRVRLISCMPRCSCAARIRSDSGQNGFCDPHTETREPPGVFACDEIDTLRHFCDWSGYASPADCTGTRGRGTYPAGRHFDPLSKRRLPGRQRGREVDEVRCR